MKKSDFITWTFILYCLYEFANNVAQAVVLPERENMIFSFVWLLNVVIWFNSMELRYYRETIDEYSKVTTNQREMLEKFKNLVKFQTEVIDEMNKK